MVTVRTTSLATEISRAFLEKSDNRESHNPVLLGKSCVPDQCSAVLLQVHFEWHTLKIGCLDCRDSLDHEFRGAEFHKCLIDSAKLLFDDPFGAASNHLFLAGSEHLDFYFEKGGEKIKRVPRGGINFRLAGFSGLFIQKVKNFLEGVLAGTRFNLVNGFLDSQSLNLHHSRNSIRVTNVKLQALSNSNNW